MDTSGRKLCRLAVPEIVKANAGQGGLQRQHAGEPVRQAVRLHRTPWPSIVDRIVALLEAAPCQRRPPYSARPAAKPKLGSPWSEPGSILAIWLGDEPNDRHSQ